MRRQAIDNLRSAIEANTERRSIEQLQAQGKRHVRVVSGEKVLQIIKAIVNDVVDREVGETTSRDRDRIVEDTKKQFDRVLKMQTDQERILQEQKDISGQYKEKFEQAEQDYTRAQSQIEELRSQQGAREGQLLAEYQEKVRDLTEKHSAVNERVRLAEHEKERVAQMLDEEKSQANEREERLRADHESRVKTLQQEQKDLVARLREEKGALAGKQEAAVTRSQERVEKLEERLSEASEAKVVAEQKVAQLSQEAAHAQAEAKQAGEKFHASESVILKLEGRLENSKVTIENSNREIERLQSELAAAREAAGKADAVGQLQGQLADMQNYLQVLDQRSSGANEATVNSLLDQLTQQQSLDTSSLEDRFNASLDASLDKISKTMEAATAKPIDIVVEATDVLVDRLFDTPDSKMSTNLDSLEVEERKSKKGIGGALAALKKMRGGAKKEEAAPEEDKSEEPVTAGAKKKVNASVERLKALRDGEEK